MHEDGAVAADLLLQLLHLLDGAPSLRALVVAVAQQGGADVVGLADVLLLLFLGLLQLALGAEALRVVHVVRLHHLRRRQQQQHI